MDGRKQGELPPIYAEFLQQREAQRFGRIEKKALKEIEAEYENLRTGWEWAVAQGKLEVIDLSLESLAEFYWLRGWLRQGEEILARTVQRLAEEQASRSAEVRAEIADRGYQAVLGKVLLQQGRFCAVLGLVEKANELLQRSLAILRDLGAQGEVAYALRHLGYLALSPGEAKPLLLEGLAIFEEIGDRRGIILSLWALSYVAQDQGEYRASRELLLEALTLSRELGNQQAIADSLAYLGTSNWCLGEYAMADQLQRESLALYQDIDDSWGMAYCLNGLAMDACGVGEFEKGKRLLQESLTICREMGYARGVARALVGLGEVANMLGEHAQAMQFAQESLPLSEEFDDQSRIGWNLKTLGDAACGLGDISGAKEYHRQAMEAAMATPAVSLTPLVLVGVASLLRAEGRTTRALALLDLVLHDPASWRWVRDRAASLIAEMEAELPAEVVAAARARGPAQDLGAAMAVLLTELRA